MAPKHSRAPNTASFSAQARKVCKNLSDATRNWDKVQFKQQLAELADKIAENHEVLKKTSFDGGAACSTRL